MDDIDFRSEHALKILKDEKRLKCEHDLTFTESDGGHGKHGTATLATRAMK